MARDPLGPFVVDLREYLAAHGGAEFAAVAVRGGGPAPGDAPPFVVLTHAGQVRERRTGALAARVQARSYGTSRQKASELARLVSDAFHDRGPRVRSGTGIYDSWEEQGAQPDTDPDTGWASELAFYRAIVAAQAVT